MVEAHSSEEDWQGVWSLRRKVTDTKMGCGRNLRDPAFLLLGHLRCQKKMQEQKKAVTEIYLLRHRRWYALKKVDLMNHEIVRLTRWRGSSPHWWFVGVSQRESAKSSSRLSSSKPWIRCYLAWLRRTQQTWNRVWCTADKKGLSERLIRFRKRDPLEAEESHLCNIHKCTSTFFLRWMNPVYVFSGF